MSRLIVKNLPKTTTEDALRKKFSEKGLITDVQLKYTKNGKFRQFAFIGYQTEEEANAAVNYFDKTYFDSLRITVEHCAQLGDDKKPKAWSKYATDSSAYKKLNQPQKPVTEKKQKEKEPKKISKELSEKLLQFKNDPEFLEFLEVHGKDKTRWGNDDVTSFMLSKADNEEIPSDGKDSGVEDGIEDDSEDVNKVADENISDAEYLKRKTGLKTVSNIIAENTESEKNTQYFTLVVRGLPFKAKKKVVKEFFRPVKLDSIRIPTKINRLAYVGFKTEDQMKKALSKNKSFIDGKQIFVYPLKMDECKRPSKDQNQINPKWISQEECLKNEEDIVESGRIFVRNLSYTCTEAELQEVFEKYGPVTEVIVPIDKITRKVKGFGLVTYLIPEHAVKAYTALDGTILHGRMLHLLPGKAKQIEEYDDIAEGSSFKKKKQSKLKAEAGLSHNWNTLFLGHDTVAAVIAQNYNTSKEKVLAGSNAAVRLALGETQIVNETREFLEENGVKLDAFNRTINHRSKTIILVKNLPVNTTANEIRETFAKFGLLGRVLLPPNGITAIVEFLEPAEARTAFRKLAYSKFKNLPLYLEWAPDDTFTSSFTNISDGNPSTDETKQKNNNTEIGDGDEPDDNSTLFIKNLNFETTEEDLQEHFRDCGKIANVTVAKRKDPSKPGNLLSMGYGFVQFYRQSSVNQALKIKQQSMLHNHCIELKRSNRTTKTQAHVSKKSVNVENSTGTKILIRNIPFQAKKSEIEELFETFGELKAVRLPRKMVGTGPHRGFAFIEYFEKDDAKRAMQSLCQSTHLYGRRLVLEWAQTTEDDIEQLRKRTAERVKIGEEVRSKKSTADIVVEESDED